MVHFVWIIVALLTSAVVDMFIFARWLSGTLLIDRSNPDKDMYRIEIDDLDKLPKRKYIILAIDKKDLSQK